MHIGAINAQFYVLSFCCELLGIKVIIVFVQPLKLCCFIEIFNGVDMSSRENHALKYNGY